MRFMPAWKQMTAVAHTLPNDLSIVVGHQQGQPLPPGYYDRVTAPTLVIAGAKSPTYVRNAQAAIAEAVPDARLEVLPGQTHMIKPKPSLRCWSLTSPADRTAQARWSGRSPLTRPPTGLA
jgi:hypothetical protein